METLDELALRLGELAAVHGAAEVSTRVKALRVQKSSAETVNKLAEIINELVSDRAELLGLARALHEEIITQRIEDSDLEFIVNEVVPTLESMLNLSPDKSGQEAIDAVKVLLRKETLDVLQVLGFSFKEAIGQPLTTLVRDFILSASPDGDTELDKLRLELQIETLKAVNDAEAFERLQRIS